MTREWLETIRALAHKSTLGGLLMIAPPGSAESENMRRRLVLLADFAQHVVESVDDDELRAAKVSREAHATGTRSEPPVPDRRAGPPDRRLTEQLVHSLVGGRMWQKQRLVDYGRRSTDKR